MITCEQNTPPFVLYSKHFPPQKKFKRRILKNIFSRKRFFFRRFFGFKNSKKMKTPGKQNRKRRKMENSSSAKNERTIEK